MSAGQAGPVVVGITGGIGSGKSRASRSLAGLLGVPVIDIDGICRMLLTRDGEGWQALRRHLPAVFFSDDGHLDRQALRRAIFGDEHLRQQINALIHPLAYAEMERMLRAGTDELVLVDVPLLYEAGWQDTFSRVVVVYADAESRCRRLMLRDRLGREEVAGSMRCQLPLRQKALRADHVVNNSGCWATTWMELKRLASVLEQECRGGSPSGNGSGCSTWQPGEGEAGSG